MRSRKRRRISAKKRSYGSRASLAKIVKSIALKQSETKYAVLTAENQAIWHNGGTKTIFAKNLLFTSHGSNQNSRIGDEVIAKGLKIKCWFSNKSDRTNVIYRLFVISVPKDQLTADNPSGLFENHHGNLILDQINTDRYKVIAHKQFSIKGGQLAFTSTVVPPSDTGIRGKENSKYVSMYIPLKNRKVKYEVDGGGDPKYQNNMLCMGVIAYDAFGTLTIDNIASFAYTTKFYYKDP